MDNSTNNFEAFRDWMTLRNYASTTIKSYSSQLRQFLLWRQRLGKTEEIEQEEIKRYLTQRSDEGLSWHTINVIYSALRMFLTEVLRRDWSVDNLPRPRSEKSLPTILSTTEVERLINAGTLLKHQAFMALLYGTGLWLSEALELRIKDIDGERGQLRVSKGKGKKDRYVHLAPILLETLRTYYKACRPEDYLFNGSYPGSRWKNRAAVVSCGMLARSAAA